MQTLNRKVPPTTFDFTTVSELPSPYMEHSLSNKIPVYACQVAGSPKIKFIFLFEAGSAMVNERGQASAVSHMLCDILDDWANAQESTTQPAFEFYSGTFHGLDYSRVEFTVLGIQFEAFLPALHKKLFEVEFSPEGYASYRETIEDMLEDEKDSDPDWVSNAVEEALYGKNHPFMDADYIDSGALTLESVQAFYKERHQQGKIKICIAGDLPGNFLDLLERQFGMMPNQPNGKFVEIPSFALRRATKFGTHVASKDEDNDSALIRLATAFALPDRMDFWGVGLIHFILGKWKESRLDRVSKRFKWFKFLWSNMQRKMNYFEIELSGGVKKGSSSDGIEEMREVLQSLADEEMSDEDLKRAKSSYIAAILEKNDGGMNAASYWEKEIHRGYEPDYLTKGLQVLKTITPQDIIVIANKYFDPRNFHLATVS